MDYFDNPQNVQAYIKMADGYDGQALIDRLAQHLAKDATLLELGSGPGVDLELLSKHFVVTGSDRSKAFLEHFATRNTAIEYLLLDAIHLDLDRKFDCIYANKVLHHLTREDLSLSLEKQASLLNPDGLICHSFWYGDKTEELHGMLFNYYQESHLKSLVAEKFSILEMVRYSEMEEQDSILLIAKLGG